MFFSFDNLVYSKNLEVYLSHLAIVFDILQHSQWFAKHSKCHFSCVEIEYLGHVISQDGVKVDPKKIDSMLNWPIPKNLKALRDFLGLTGY